MSTIKFLHEKKETSIVDGKRVTEEEYIIDGEKGLYVKYFSQEDKERMKIIIKSKNDKFIMIVSKGEEKGEEKEMSHDELLEKVAKHKQLAFALKYLKDRKKQKGGAKKSSRKSSRKASKKASKKTSKKASKKSSKKTKKSSRK
jgi:topoisomerase IA-like protein